MCLSSVSASSIFKHYRVTRAQDGSFNIDVENPVSEKSKDAFRVFYQTLSQLFSHSLIKSLPSRRLRKIGQLEDGFEVFF